MKTSYSKVAEDICTVVSIIPFELREFKPGVYPGNFNIPACLNEEEPVMFYVGSSVHVMQIGNKAPITIETPSFRIAKSLVDDYMDGQLWLDEECRPGLTWLQGRVELDVFIDRHTATHKELLTSQRNWALEIIKHTDDDYKRYRTHKVVSDQARYFAKKLGLDTEWMHEETLGLNDVRCPACHTPVDQKAIVCSACRCILKPEEYKKLQFATV